MKGFVVLSILFFSHLVHSAEGQYFFQPKGGEHVLTPRIGAGIIRVTTPDATLAGFEDTTTVGSLLSGIEYEYGVLDTLSIGIEQSYSYTDVSFESTSSISRGLDDIFIYSKGFYRFSSIWTLRYGLGTSLSLENSTSENQYSGRNELLPYLGLDVLLADRHRIGGRLSYEFLLGKQKQENSVGAVTEFEGGETLSVDAFYEFNWDKGLVGVSPSYWTISGSESGGVTSDTQRFVSTVFFANFFFTDSFTLIPSVASTLLLNHEVNGTEINSYTGVSTGLGARFIF